MKLKAVFLIAICLACFTANVSGTGQVMVTQIDANSDAGVLTLESSSVEEANLGVDVVDDLANLRSLTFTGSPKIDVFGHSDVNMDALNSDIKFSAKDELNVEGFKEIDFNARNDVYIDAFNNDVSFKAGEKTTFYATRDVIIKAAHDVNFEGFNGNVEFQAIRKVVQMNAGTDHDWDAWQSVFFRALTQNVEITTQAPGDDVVLTAQNNVRGSALSQDVYMRSMSRDINIDAWQDIRLASEGIGGGIFIGTNYDTDQPNEKYVETPETYPNPGYGNIVINAGKDGDGVVITASVVTDVPVASPNDVLIQTAGGPGPLASVGNGGGIQLFVTATNDADLRRASNPNPQTGVSEGDIRLFAAPGQILAATGEIGKNDCSEGNICVHSRGTALTQTSPSIPAFAGSVILQTPPSYLQRVQAPIQNSDVFIYSYVNVSSVDTTSRKSSDMGRIIFATGAGPNGGATANCGVQDLEFDTGKPVEPGSIVFGNLFDQTTGLVSGSINIGTGTVQRPSVPSEFDHFLVVNGGLPSGGVTFLAGEVNPSNPVGDTQLHSIVLHTPRKDTGFTNTNRGAILVSSGDNTAGGAITMNNPPVNSIVINAFGVTAAPQTGSVFVSTGSQSSPSDNAIYVVASAQDPQGNEYYFGSLYTSTGFKVISGGVSNTINPGLWATDNDVVSFVWSQFDTTTPGTPPSNPGSIYVVSGSMPPRAYRSLRLGDVLINSDGGNTGGGLTTGGGIAVGTLAIPDPGIDNILIAASEGTGGVYVGTGPFTPTVANANQNHNVNDANTPQDILFCSRGTVVSGQNVNQSPDKITGYTGSTIITTVNGPAANLPWTAALGISTDIKLLHPQDLIVNAAANPVGGGATNFGGILMTTDLQQLTAASIDLTQYPTINDIIYTSPPSARGGIGLFTTTNTENLSNAIGDQDILVVARDTGSVLIGTQNIPPSAPGKGFVIINAESKSSSFIGGQGTSNVIFVAQSNPSAANSALLLDPTKMGNDIIIAALANQPNPSLLDGGVGVFAGNTYNPLHVPVNSVWVASRTQGGVGFLTGKLPPNQQGVTGFNQVNSAEIEDSSIIFNANGNSYAAVPANLEATIMVATGARQNSDNQKGNIEFNSAVGGGIMVISGADNNLMPTLTPNKQQIVVNARNTGGVMICTGLSCDPSFVGDHDITLNTWPTAAASVGGMVFHALDVANLPTPKPFGITMSAQGVLINTGTRAEKTDPILNLPVNIAANGATFIGTTVTITTTTPHGFAVGQSVVIHGVAVPNYNGVFTITGISSPTAFTYTVAGIASNSGGGTAATVSSRGITVQAEGPLGALRIGAGTTLLDPQDYNTIIQATTAASPGGSIYLVTGQPNVVNGVETKVRGWNSAVVAHASTSNTFSAQPTNAVGNIVVSSAEVLPGAFSAGLPLQQSIYVHSPGGNGGILVAVGETTFLPAPGVNDLTVEVTNSIFGSSDDNSVTLNNPNIYFQASRINNVYFIATATESTNTVTITTTTPHGLAVGQSVLINNVGVAGYNGFFTILSVFPLPPLAPTSFTYNNPISGLGPSGGGTASAVDVNQNKVAPTITLRSFGGGNTAGNPAGADVASNLPNVNAGLSGKIRFTANIIEVAATTDSVQFQSAGDYNLEAFGSNQNPGLLPVDGYSISMITQGQSAALCTTLPDGTPAPNKPDYCGDSVYMNAASNVLINSQTGAVQFAACANNNCGNNPGSLSQDYLSLKADNKIMVYGSEIDYFQTSQDAASNGIQFFTVDGGIAVQNNPSSCSAGSVGSSCFTYADCCSNPFTFCDGTCPPPITNPLDGEITIQAVDAITMQASNKVIIRATPPSSPPGDFQSGYVTFRTSQDQGGVVISATADSYPFPTSDDVQFYADGTIDTFAVNAILLESETSKVIVQSNAGGVSFEQGVPKYTNLLDGEIALRSVSQGAIVNVIGAKGINIEVTGNNLLNNLGSIEWRSHGPGVTFTASNGGVAAGVAPANSAGQLRLISNIGVSASNTAATGKVLVRSVDDMTSVAYGENLHISQRSLYDQALNDYLYPTTPAQFCVSGSCGIRFAATRTSSSGGVVQVAPASIVNGILFYADKTIDAFAGGDIYIGKGNLANSPAAAGVVARTYATGTTTGGLSISATWNKSKLPHPLSVHVNADANVFLTSQNCVGGCTGATTGAYVQGGGAGSVGDGDVNVQTHQGHLVVHAGSSASFPSLVPQGTVRFDAFSGTLPATGTITMQANEAIYAEATGTYPSGDVSVSTSATTGKISVTAGSSGGLSAPPVGSTVVFQAFNDVLFAGGTVTSSYIKGGNNNLYTKGATNDVVFSTDSPSSDIEFDNIANYGVCVNDLATHCLVNSDCAVAPNQCTAVIQGPPTVFVPAVTLQAQGGDMYWQTGLNANMLFSSAGGFCQGACSLAPWVACRSNADCSAFSGTCGGPLNALCYTDADCVSAASTLINNFSTLTSNTAALKCLPGSCSNGNAPCRTDGDCGVGTCTTASVRIASGGRTLVTAGPGENILWTGTSTVVSGGGFNRATNALATEIRNSFTVDGVTNIPETYTDGFDLLGEATFNGNVQVNNDALPTHPEPPYPGFEVLEEFTGQSSLTINGGSTTIRGDLRVGLTAGANSNSFLGQTTFKGDVSIIGGKTTVTGKNIVGNFVVGPVFESTEPVGATFNSDMVIATGKNIYTLQTDQLSNPNARIVPWSSLDTFTVPVGADLTVGPDTPGTDSSAFYVENGVFRSNVDAGEGYWFQETVTPQNPTPNPNLSQHFGVAFNAAKGGDFVGSVAHTTTATSISGNIGSRMSMAGYGIFGASLLENDPNNLISSRILDSFGSSIPNQAQVSDPLSSSPVTNDFGANYFATLTATRQHVDDNNSAGRWGLRLPGGIAALDDQANPFASFYAKEGGFSLEYGSASIDGGASLMFQPDVFHNTYTARDIIQIGKVVSSGDFTHYATTNSFAGATNNINIFTSTQPGNRLTFDVDDDGDINFGNVDIMQINEGFQCAAGIGGACTHSIICLTHAGNGDWFLGGCQISLTQSATIANNCGACGCGTGGCPAAVPGVPSAFRDFFHGTSVASGVLPQSDCEAAGCSKFS